MAGSTRADTVVLSDLYLAEWIDQGWAPENTLNYKTDLLGDPGYLYNLTIDRTAEGGAWDDMGIGQWTDIPLEDGDTWEITIYNPYSNGYPLWIGAYYDDKN